MGVSDSAETVARRTAETARRRRYGTPTAVEALSETITLSSAREGRFPVRERPEAVARRRTDDARHRRVLDAMETTTPAARPVLYDVVDLHCPDGPSYHGSWCEGCDGGDCGDGWPPPWPCETFLLVERRLGLALDPTVIRPTGALRTDWTGWPDDEPPGADPE